MLYSEWVEANRFLHAMDITFSHIAIGLIGFIGGIVFSIGRAVYKVESMPDSWLIFNSHNHDGKSPKRRKDDCLPKN